MLRLTRIVRALASWQVDLAAIAAALILLQVSLDLILRYVFAAPIQLSTEIVAYYYLVPLIFLPLMLVELEDHHITTDLFFARFPARAQALLLDLGSVLSILLYLLLAWFSLKAAISATHKGEVVMGAQLLPIWPMRWLLPFAFVMAAFGALIALARRHLIGPEAQPPHNPEDAIYE